MLNDATRRQQAAARPDLSTWVTANAGSGKTRVLTDRVARLLLNNVPPQNILCLTYTKAAASEMQNRLFRRLGDWAMRDDASLSRTLMELGEDRVLDSQTLRDARTLFARAIETPGGLKIQTIHAFCAAILRRFPLEAGVIPNFVEMDDRASQIMRAEIMDEMAQGPQREAVSDVARWMSDQDFDALTRAILNDRDAFADHSGDAHLFAMLGLPEGITEDQIVEAAFGRDGMLILASLIPAMQAGSTNDVKAAAKLVLVTEPSLRTLPILESVFLSGDKTKTPFGAKIGSVPTKKTAETLTGLLPALHDFMTRVETTREQRLAFTALEPTRAIHAFAKDFLPRYDAAKTARGLLDFDDLIRKTRVLLTGSEMAGWVLYKLDGQIDHILVDEAQDTSPAQWDVIQKLSEEFTAGASARDGAGRSIFVVGDKKQSIYSFQGADPRAFDAMKSTFSVSLTAIDAPLQSQSLDHSFRSAPSILRVVDTVFDGAEAQALGGASEHVPFHTSLPGRVDHWPLLPPSEAATDTEWDDPVDLPSPDHHHARLATLIAEEIKRMIDVGVQIPEAGGAARPAQPRDFLILVQRRSGIFPHIIRACKNAQLPIAGSDKLKVGTELAVRDLGAFLAFLATPDDDLSLAAVLKSPLFGWDEAMLFALAHHRPEGMRLWAHLRGQADKYPDTCAVLTDMRRQADFLRPFDLIERLLTRHDRRRRIIARLGTEAEDGIDALLGQAMAYEQSAIPSLTGFLAWMQTDDLEIKRQIDSASNQIRVMSVHGAKGLEAPIVILPDTIRNATASRDSFVTVDGAAIYKPPRAEQPALVRKALAATGEAEAAEARRLLYVAMTRAEKWLIVAGAGKASGARQDWHDSVGQAMPHAGAVALDTPGGEGMRVENGIWPDEATTQIEADPATAPLPEIFSRPASPVQPGTKTLSPSDLGGAKALPGEGRDEETALAYGTFVHELLERYREGQDLSQIAARVSTNSLPEGLQAEAIEEVCRIADDASCAPLFAADALREVDVTATLGSNTVFGAIDCLLVSGSNIRIIDFKTNRAIPNAPEDTPLGILRQMAAYAHAIEQIYPGHTISCEVLWTARPCLMQLPHDLVYVVQQDLVGLDAPDHGS